MWTHICHLEYIRAEPIFIYLFFLIAKKILQKLGHEPGKRGTKTRLKNHFSHCSFSIKKKKEKKEEEEEEESKKERKIEKNRKEKKRKEKKRKEKKRKEKKRKKHSTFFDKSL